MFSCVLALCFFLVIRTTVTVVPGEEHLRYTWMQLWCQNSLFKSPGEVNFLCIDPRCLGLKRGSKHVNTQALDKRYTHACFNFN